MILQKLKESTKHQHDDVEGAVDVMSKLFSLDDYRRMIAKFRSFYSAYEPALPYEALKMAGFDYDGRRKLPLLDRDAKALAIQDVEEFTELPDVSSLPRAFGSIYVIEGSTLGGQVISRHLRQHLGLTPENGGAFFASYGSKVGAMWKQFGDAITAFSGQGANDEEIVGAAKETFDSISVCRDK
jgi:heme oxygenase